MVDLTYDIEAGSDNLFSLDSILDDASPDLLDMLTDPLPDPLHTAEPVCLKAEYDFESECAFSLLFLF